MTTPRDSYAWNSESLRLLALSESFPERGFEPLSIGSMRKNLTTELSWHLVTVSALKNDLSQYLLVQQGFSVWILSTAFLVARTSTFRVCGIYFDFGSCYRIFGHEIFAVPSRLLLYCGESVGLPCESADWLRGLTYQM